MHILSLHWFHVFEQRMTLSNHHTKMTIIFLVIAIICIGFVLSSQSDHIGMSQFTGASEISVHTANTLRPLTRLDNPQYSHEREIRSQHIRHALNQLKLDAGADRAYAFSYRYESSRMGGMMEIKVASILEVSQEGLPYQLEDDQKLSRRNWLFIARDNSTTSGFLPGPVPHSYGLELYDVSGRPVGYIGMEYWQEQPKLKGDELPLLRKTAVEIRETLLAPLETLRPL